jgi:hypothetical protein
MGECEMQQRSDTFHMQYYHSLLSNGYWVSFPGVSKLKCEVDHSSPSSAEVKNEYSYTSTLPVCLYGVERDKFTFRVLTGILLNPIMVMVLM